MTRFRRLRSSPNLRRLVQETRLSKDDFVQPFFVVEGKNKREAVPSMPGIYRYSIDTLLKAVERYRKAGGYAGLFFGLPAKKDLKGSEAVNKNGVIQKTVRAIKKEFPDFLVITDVCLCSYTSHGHCGIIKNNSVDNDETIAVLGRMAVSHTEAGADIVAPSDMMDFRVRRIRDDLEKNGFLNTVILSYAVKYASAFYGPFRDAAHSAPHFGDRKSYQMNPANAREALKEAKKDIEEGADMVMVKPALAYLDIISLLKKELTVPVVAYSVSGEYSMIEAAAAKNWINKKDILLESLTAIKRAGADIIISYHSEEALKWLSQNP